MDAKSVLVCYKERSKVFVLSASENKNELESLTEETKKAFSIRDDEIIIFKRYDLEWDEYIDLDDCSVLLHKDKLRAVTSLSLVKAPFEVQSTSLSSNFSYSSAENLSQIMSTSDDGECNGELSCNPPKRHRFLDNDTDSDDHDDDDKETQDKQHKMSIKRNKTLLDLPSAIKKEEVTEKPLPDPFPLPEHYRSDVEVGLKTGKMSREAKKSFLSSVASAMFGYKKYPTSEEYTRVALQMITKYPFLKPPSGSSTASIKQSLINRFKEFRRLPKNLTDNNPKEKSLGKENPKMPGVDAIMKPPIIPSGEDQTSFERHNKRLLLEFKKAQPNIPVVTELMVLSYAMRRQDILKNSYSITEILEHYPFLQFCDQLYLDMERILQAEKLQAASRECWSKTWAPRIIAQAHLERSKCKKLCLVLDQVLDEECSLEIAALTVLPYLLSDSRVKPEHERVFIAIPETCDLQEAINSKGQTEPYITILGSYSAPVQAFLVTDCCVVCEVKIEDIPLSLLAAFFVFNIQYPKGCHNAYTFLEYALFSLHHKKQSPSVDHFLAALS